MAPVLLWQGAAVSYKAGCGQDVPWSRLFQEGDNTKFNGQHIILLCSWESCNVLSAGQNKVLKLGKKKAGLWIPNCPQKKKDQV